jgi:hypothetical protein
VRAGMACRWLLNVRGGLPETGENVTKFPECMRVRPGWIGQPVQPGAIRWPLATRIASAVAGHVCPLQAFGAAARMAANG